MRLALRILLAEPDVPGARIALFIIGFERAADGDDVAAGFVVLIERVQAEGILAGRDVEYRDSAEQRFGAGGKLLAVLEQIAESLDHQQRTWKSQNDERARVEGEAVVGIGADGEAGAERPAVLLGIPFPEIVNADIRLVIPVRFRRYRIPGDQRIASRLHVKGEQPGKAEDRRSRRTKWNAHRQFQPAIHREELEFLVVRRIVSLSDRHTRVEHQFRLFEGQHRGAVEALVGADFREPHRALEFERAGNFHIDADAVQRDIDRVVVQGDAQSIDRGIALDALDQVHLAGETDPAPAVGDLAHAELGDLDGEGIEVERLLRRQIDPAALQFDMSVAVDGKLAHLEARPVVPGIQRRQHPRDAHQRLLVLDVDLDAFDRDFDEARLGQREDAAGGGDADGDAAFRVVADIDLELLVEKRKGHVALQAHAGELVLREGEIDRFRLERQAEEFSGRRRGPARADRAAEPRRTDEQLRSGDVVGAAEALEIVTEMDGEAVDRHAFEAGRRVRNRRRQAGQMQLNPEDLDDDAGIADRHRRHFDTVEALDVDVAIGGDSYLGARERDRDRPQIVLGVGEGHPLRPTERHGPQQIRLNAQADFKVMESHREVGRNLHLERNFCKACGRIA